MADDLPGPGFIPGDVHLNPSLAPDVPEGEARPFAPGEYVSNPNGSWSSEETMTVPHPTQDDKWANIPSLWLKDGKPYVAHDEDEATELARNSQLPWPAYGSADEANMVAGVREARWQGIEPENADSVPPLWAPEQYAIGGAVLPPRNALHDGMAAARIAGYPWQEINQFTADRRDASLSVGYSHSDVNAFLGIGSPDDLNDRLRQTLHRNIAAQ
jgi:hypothetical protein